MRIAFLWNGCESVKVGRLEHSDGLGAAVRILAQRHTVDYFEPDDLPGITAFKPDVLLYHAALTEAQPRVVNEYPFKKALCFAGGPIERENVLNFDLYFIESQINAKEFQAMGKRWMTAFGINDDLFLPIQMTKKWDVCFAGAFAAWKRPELVAPFGNRAVAVGQFQETEKHCYEVCQKAGVDTRPLTTRGEIAQLMCQSHTVLNGASFWGGGQRLTLEAMSCNVPPIVMADSPENIEYVEESGYGVVVNPDLASVQAAVEDLKAHPMKGGREYILSKWTARHYAKALETGLMSL